ncbi:GntR family transcriptional regulator [Cumulibacter soli]|uniref:GntR family transcriptional regulator n=1 Tax=Cumulibacter soli TaxID=2546344 RepID=UPI0010683495|nr:GntR family transcriptional regulator [Cumulibacter soli]
MAAPRSEQLPLHVQVHDAIRDLIDTGVLEPGAKLPTEIGFAAEFGVNRLTVRQALSELARVGLIVRRQGSGTFVAPRLEPFEVEMSPWDWAVQHERSTRAMQEQGRQLRESLLDVAEVDAPADAAEHLGRGRLTWLELVHILDGAPIIRTQLWTRTAWSVEQIRQRGNESFDHSMLRDIVGHDMYYAWRSFDAVPAGPRDAEVLGVSTGSPLLRRCGLNSDRAGVPLLYLQRDAPSGRMRILIRSEPPPGDATSDTWVAVCPRQ